MDLDSIETIPVVRVNPVLRQVIPIQISIPADKEASVREDRSSREEIKIYTDGSIHNEKVGAAAVLYRKGWRRRMLRLHMGKASDHTIYEAELVGLLLGIQLLKTETKGKTKCTIRADNQAAIKALQSKLTNPGQHLTAEFLKMADQVATSKRKSMYSITVWWTAGHCGIKGNEEVDKEAKRVAEGDSSAEKNIPKYISKTIRKSTSALKQDRNKNAKEKWKSEWNESDRFKRFKALDIISPASRKFTALISDHRVSKGMASLIYQLRVGHAPLNSYLHQFKKVESAQCPACGAKCKMTEHFILHCLKYDHERWALKRHVREQNPKIIHILSNAKTLIPLINYIEATEWFKAQEQG